MNLQTFFADTVAASWAPRNPCTDPSELARLEQSGVRGDCIWPLLMAGDTIFIDRNAKPEPGDVVSFRLSQRGADAQNSALPPGQSSWSPGSRWCKLFGTRHGLDFLYDRHGGEATATLMACEHPDDTPVLHPIRNIRRNGKLLFGGDQSPQLTRRALLAGAVVAPLALAGCDDGSGPFTMLPACTEDVSGAQIGSNAVSQTVSNFVASTITETIPLSGLTQNIDVITASLTTIGGAVGVDISSDVLTSITPSGAGILNVCTVSVSRDGTLLSTSLWDATKYGFGGGAGGGQHVTLTITDNPSAGAHTYGIRLTAGASGGIGTVITVSFTGSEIKVREYKK